MTSEKTDLCFCESYNHRVNTAKHSCKVVKYHTIATRHIINPTSPIQLWVQFMPQIKATLNIL